MSAEEVPIRRLWKLREKLNEAVAESRWDEAASLAEAIVSDIRLAVDPMKCQTGRPTLDGLYSFGTMRYMRAPQNAKRALNKMNRILKTAKKNIPRKGK